MDYVTEIDSDAKVLEVHERSRHVSKQIYRVFIRYRPFGGYFGARMQLCHGFTDDRLLFACRLHHLLSRIHSIFFKNCSSGGNLFEFGDTDSVIDG